jgi:competence protein ComEC
MQRNAQIIWGSVGILAVVAVLVWSAAWRAHPGVLTVSFLDIGQGDSIFIESPTGRQMLVDGGLDRTVLRELGSVMPWWDRSIDVVVATHPDADHISGLVDVLQRYRVSYIFQPGIGHNTSQAESLLSSVAQEGAQEMIARRGQIVDLGGGAYFEILHPDRDVATAETNEGCIVGRVVYGDTAFMLTCDAPIGVEQYLAALGTDLHADVLKAGHHGSRTSSSPLFVGLVSPQWGVFSRGCDNKYGHPHAETVAVFKKFGIPVVDTCTDGRVTFVSDGGAVTRK